MLLSSQCFILWGPCDITGCWITCCSSWAPAAQGSDSAFLKDLVYKSQRENLIKQGSKEHMHLMYRMTQKENKCLYQCLPQSCPHNHQDGSFRGYCKKTNHSPPASSWQFFVSHPFSSSSKLFPEELSVGGDSSPPMCGWLLPLSHPPAPFLWIYITCRKIQKNKTTLFLHIPEMAPSE